MNNPRRIFRWLATAACCVQSLLAQTPTNPSAPAASLTAPTNSAPLPLQFSKSPVERFRELLVMPTAERSKSMIAYPPERRTQILEKIAEYQSLDPEERESRLQVTELRWYLLPLLNTPATNRAALLAQIPPAVREKVEPRLHRLTVLPPEWRQVLLTNEQVLDYVANANNPDDNLPALAEDQRRKLSESFKKLLELTPTEKAKALRTLSDADRRQMEKTLMAFEKLPPDRRARCVRSFAKFAVLNPAEQQEFLKNAELWSLMSLAERQTWNELVNLVSSLPPLPRKGRPALIGFPLSSNATNRK